MCSSVWPALRTSSVVSVTNALPLSTTVAIVGGSDGGAGGDGGVCTGSMSSSRGSTDAFDDSMNTPLVPPLGTKIQPLLSDGSASHLSTLEVTSTVCQPLEPDAYPTWSPRMAGLYAAPLLMLSHVTEVAHHGTVDSRTSAALPELVTL